MLPANYDKVPPCSKNKPSGNVKHVSHAAGGNNRTVPSTAAFPSMCQKGA
jgi:hypothetical protein